MSTMTQKEEKQIEKEIHAYHEAGHAALAALWGVRIESVTIKEELGKYLGKTSFTSDTLVSSDELEILKEKFVIICYAGWYSSKPFNPDPTSIDHDEQLAHEFIRKYFPTINECEYVEKCKRIAEEEVQRNKAYILAVVKELLARVTLTGVDVKEIVNVEFRKACSAYHEAGHAVIATVLGVPVENVTIGTHPKYNGETLYKDIGKDEDTDYMQKRAIVAFAGGFAAIDYDPNGLTVDHDFQFASKVALKLTGKKGSDAFLKNAEKEARDEVSRNKEPIEALAKKLYLSGSLNGQLVEEIIHKNLTN